MRKGQKILGAIIISALLATTSGVQGVAAEKTTDFCVKIVHTNDIHARVEENAGSGIIGMSKLKTLIDQYTEGADMDLVVDSGDLFHGQSIATLVQGESIAELVKACDYDAMTAGNHDWNYGKDRLKELVAKADVKMLAGNVVDESGNMFFDTPFYCETMIKNGQELKVGVFGAIDPSVYRDTSPANVKGLTFKDSVAYAGKAASELEEMGCDIVIGLTHTRNPVSLASKVNGVDLWLAGHEHKDIDTKVTTPDGSSSYVLENGYYSCEAGLIDLDCTLDSKGDVVAITVNAEKADYKTTGELAENTEVRTVLEKIKKEQGVILERVVGTSPAALDGDWYSLRLDETNLGRAVTDAYLLETGADIAFENAGGMRASVKKGNVTYGDIISVCPFGNYIVTKQITGKQLREILEISIDIQKKNIAANASGKYDAWPENSGSYLQAGGISVNYNPELSYGKRVLSVQVGNKSLKDERVYTVAMNNFLATSPYYPQLAKAEEAGEYSSCEEALIKYFSQSEDIIARGVTTPRMVKTNTTNASKEPVKPSQKETKEPGQTKIKSAENKKEKTITIQLSKAKNAKKYEICYATDKNFKKAKSKLTQKLTYSLTNLKKGKTYYIKARSINGKMSGKWSAICKVKVKK